MATESKPNAPCQKCGGTDFIRQLRQVQVDVGWRLAQINAVAPTHMCTKCGNLTVAINANIGDLANLVPDVVAMERLKAAGATPVPKGGVKKRVKKSAKKPR